MRYSNNAFYKFITFLLLISFFSNVCFSNDFSQHSSTKNLVQSSSTLLNSNYLAPASQYSIQNQDKEFDPALVPPMPSVSLNAPNTQNSVYKRQISKAGKEKAKRNLKKVTELLQKAAYWTYINFVPMSFKYLSNTFFRNAHAKVSAFVLAMMLTFPISFNLQNLPFNYDFIKKAYAVESLNVSNYSSPLGYPLWWSKDWIRAGYVYTDSLAKLAYLPKILDDALILTTSNQNKVYSGIIAEFDITTNPVLEWKFYPIDLINRNLAPDLIAQGFEMSSVILEVVSPQNVLVKYQGYVRTHQAGHVVIEKDILENNGDAAIIMLQNIKYPVAAVESPGAVYKLSTFQSGINTPTKKTRTDRTYTLERWDSDAISPIDISNTSAIIIGPNADKTKLTTDIVASFTATEDIYLDILYPETMLGKGLDLKGTDGKGYFEKNGFTRVSELDGVYYENQGTYGKKSLVVFNKFIKKGEKVNLMGIGGDSGSMNYIAVCSKMITPISNISVLNPNLTNSTFEATPVYLGATAYSDRVTQGNQYVISDHSANLRNATFLLGPNDAKKFSGDMYSFIINSDKPQYAYILREKYLQDNPATYMEMPEGFNPVSEKITVSQGIYGAKEYIAYVKMSAPGEEITISLPANSVNQGSAPLVAVSDIPELITDIVINDTQNASNYKWSVVYNKMSAYPDRADFYYKTLPQIFLDKLTFALIPGNNLKTNINSSLYKFKTVTPSTVYIAYSKIAYQQGKVPASISQNFTLVAGAEAVMAQPSFSKEETFVVFEKKYGAGEIVEIPGTGISGQSNIQIFVQEQDIPQELFYPQFGFKVKYFIDPVNSLLYIMRYDIVTNMLLKVESKDLNSIGMLGFSINPAENPIVMNTERLLHVEISYSGSAVSYNLYQNGLWAGEMFEPLIEGAGEVYCELPPINHNFVITAMDANGVESPQSAPYFIKQDEINAHYTENPSYIVYSNDGSSLIMNYDFETDTFSLNTGFNYFPVSVNGNNIKPAIPLINVPNTVLNDYYSLEKGKESYQVFTLESSSPEMNDNLLRKLKSAGMNDLNPADIFTGLAKTFSEYKKLSEKNPVLFRSFEKIGTDIQIIAGGKPGSFFRKNHQISLNAELFKPVLNDKPEDVVYRDLFVLEHEIDTFHILFHKAIIPRDLERLKLFASLGVNVDQLLSASGFEYYRMLWKMPENLRAQIFEMFKHNFVHDEISLENIAPSKKTSYLILDGEQILYNTSNLVSNLSFLLNNPDNGNKLAVRLTKDTVKSRDKIISLLTKQGIPKESITAYTEERVETIVDKLMGKVIPERISILSYDPEGVKSKGVNIFQYSVSVPDLATLAFNVANKKGNPKGLENILIKNEQRGYYVVDITGNSKTGVKKNKELNKAA